MTDWRDLECAKLASRFALLGDPVAHSLSPQMHTAAMEAMGIEGEYLAIRVGAKEFVECLDHLVACGFTGVNVTVPHKTLAARVAMKLDETTAAIGVANTLRLEEGIEALNTDVPGFLAPLGAAPLECATLASRFGSNDVELALVLGAGGSARAAVYGLRSVGWKIRVYNRTQLKARSKLRALQIEAAATPDPGGCDLIVNCTPVGLNPGEIPDLVWDNLSPDAAVYDLAYRAGETDFLKAARERGCRTLDGREMLVEQGALSLEWWTGQPVPRDVMREAVGL